MVECPRPAAIGGVPGRREALMVTAPECLADASQDLIDTKSSARYRLRRGACGFRRAIWSN